MFGTGRTDEKSTGGAETRTARVGRASNLVLAAAGGPETLVIAARSGHILGGGIRPKRYCDKKDEFFRVELSDFSWCEGEASCRLFLIDSVVKEKLLTLANAQRAGKPKLEAAFDPELLATNRSLARLLSAIPDVDGVITTAGELRMPPVELPAVCWACRDLPRDTALVLAIDVARNGT